MKKIMLLVALIATMSSVNALTVNSDIAGNVTWTKADSPVHLVGDIYVLPGASLTIEAGVVVASYYDDLGSLAVCQGADIFVNGTADEPVIMTSAEDVATWKGSVVTRGGTTIDDGFGGTVAAVTSISTMGDPKTGVWRAVCKEWGSLAIMGKGYISASHYKGTPVVWVDDSDVSHQNTKCPNTLNKKEMEGLTKAASNDTRLLYGGDDDNDDSGSINYLSLRYGGRDTEPQAELNGLSLGAVGRATDISHVEVMNNVDDGIEIWGGTVQLKNVSIWNVGDDYLDCDEGWRGSAEKGLIVQGYSAEAKQGSGMGDNCFEIDGAEDADAQPATTVKISNFTVVGQPGKVPAYGDGGDGGTAWRDNARVQYDSCIWMDLDDQLVLFDNADTDGASGYDATATSGNAGSLLRTNTPADGTMNWVQHWTTSYNAWKAGAYADPQSCGIDFASLYEAWVVTDLTAPLCNITNSVVWGSNVKWTEYDQLVTDGADLSGNTYDRTEAGPMPIQNLVRGADVTFIAGGKLHGVQPVEWINPLPAAGVTAGGFNTSNWLAGWTAADAFGMTDTSMNLSSADLNGDGSTDLADMSIFSSQWLN